MRNESHYLGKFTPKTIAKVASIALVFYLVLLFFVSPGKTSVEGDLKSTLICQDSSWKKTEIEILSEGQKCPNIVETLLDFSEISFEQASYLAGSVRLWPSGVFGQAAVNSGIAQLNLVMSVDNLDQSEWQIPAKHFIGSKTFRISIKDIENLNNYPFDNYSGSWSTFLTDFQTNVPVPLAITVIEKPVYGWNLNVKQSRSSNEIVAQKIVNMQGEGTVNWQASRSGSVKLALLILVLVMLLNLYATTRLTKAILEKRRPPTLGALGWLATSLFAMLEIRNQFPGKPPYGIKLDLFLTYPSALCLLLFILLQTLAWIKRDDWDMKNTQE